MKVTFSRTLGFFDALSQVALRKADQDNVGEFLDDDLFKKTKVENKNTGKVYVCNNCENAFMYEEGLLDHFSNIHNDCTICNVQFNDIKPLSYQFFVEKNPV